MQDFVSVFRADKNWRKLMSGLIYWQMISENSIQYVSQKLYRFFICSYRFKHLNYEKTSNHRYDEKSYWQTDRHTDTQIDRQAMEIKTYRQTDTKKAWLTERQTNRRWKETKTDRHPERLVCSIVLGIFFLLKQLFFATGIFFLKEMWGLKLGFIKAKRF